MYTNGDCKKDREENVKRKIPRSICVLESIVSTTSIYRHMHIHVHGHAAGLRHKEEPRRKDRHERHGRALCIH